MPADVCLLREIYGVRVAHGSYVNSAIEAEERDFLRDSRCLGKMAGVLSQIMVR